MRTENNVERKISVYISTLFQTHFGESPDVLSVKLESSSLKIYFRDFLTAKEKKLISQNEIRRVEIAREETILNLELEITQVIEEFIGHQMKKIHTEWDFEKESGLMIGLIDKERKSSTPSDQICFID